MNIVRHVYLGYEVLNAYSVPPCLMGLTEGPCPCNSFVL
jgi:hypothetical protein